MTNVSPETSLSKDQNTIIFLSDTIVHLNYALIWSFSLRVHTIALKGSQKQKRKFFISYYDRAFQDEPNESFPAFL